MIDQSNIVVLKDLKNHTIAIYKIFSFALFKQQIEKLKITSGKYSYLYKNQIIQFLEVEITKNIVNNVATYNIYFLLDNIHKCKSETKCLIQKSIQSGLILLDNICKCKLEIILNRNKYLIRLDL